MTESSKEALYVIVTGTISGVASTLITNFINNHFFSNRAIIFGSYLVFAFISLILLIIPLDVVRKRQRQLFQQLLIRYRNYIRLTGFTVLIISTVFFIQYNLDYSSSQTIPELHIKLINNGSDEVYVYSWGEFVLTTPVTELTVAKGSIKLCRFDNNSYQDELIVPPNEKLDVYGQILNYKQYQPYFKREDLVVTLILCQMNGKILISSKIPFNNHTFSNQYVPLEV